MLAGPRDYHMFARWLTPSELLVAQGIPVFGSAVPWAKEAEASEDERRIQPVSSFQTNLPQRSQGQVCSSACWKLRRLNCFFCVLAMSEEARSVSTPI